MQRSMCLTLTPEACCNLLLLQDASVVVPDVSKTEKAWSENCVALSALVRALHQEKKVRTACSGSCSATVVQVEKP
jgi:hypothetical protein